MFKLQISSIFHFDRASYGWMAHVLGVKKDFFGKLSHTEHDRTCNVCLRILHQVDIPWTWNILWLHRNEGQHKHKVFWITRLWFLYQIPPLVKVGLVPLVYFLPLDNTRTRIDGGPVFQSGIWTEHGLFLCPRYIFHSGP